MCCCVPIRVGVMVIDGTQSLSLMSGLQVRMAVVEDRENYCEQTKGGTGERMDHCQSRIGSVLLITTVRSTRPVVKSKHGDWLYC